jgi:hypothetical protein
MLCPPCETFPVYESGDDYDLWLGPGYVYNNPDAYTSHPLYCQMCEKISGFSVNWYKTPFTRPDKRFEMISACRVCLIFIDDDDMPEVEYTSDAW